MTSSRAVRLLPLILLTGLPLLQACEEQGRVEYDSLDQAQGPARVQLERAIEDLEALKFPKVWEARGDDQVSALDEPGRTFGSVVRTYDEAKERQFLRWWENQGESRGSAATCVDHLDDLARTCDVWVFSPDGPDSRLTATYEEDSRDRGSVTVTVYSQE